MVQNHTITAAARSAAHFGQLTVTAAEPPQKQDKSVPPRVATTMMPIVERRLMLAARHTIYTRTVSDNREAEASVRT